MASTDAVAEEIGRVLVAHGEGPALALPEEPASHMVVHDAGSDPRWQRWAHALVDLGIHSALSTRLATRKTLIGALSLYAKRPLAFDNDDIAVAQILAQHASVALAATRHEYAMGQAIDARKRIGQAQGLLMERHGINADQAFAMLRRYSQAHRMKLNTVAQCVIDGKRDLPQTSASPRASVESCRGRWLIAVRHPVD